MKDLSIWSKYDLFWLRRVNSVKMMLLPHLLYLFRSLPIPIRKTKLLQFQSSIIKFIWGSKGRCCSKDILFRLKSQGGLALPNIWWYYQAAQLAQVSIVYLKGSKPDWLLIERQAVPHHTIDYLLWSLPRLRPAILVPTLSHTLALWDRLQKHSALTSDFRPLAHLFRNPEFPPGQNILAFKWWLNKRFIQDRALF